MADDNDTQLAQNCYRCGYALAGLDSGPCPECGARDITLAHDRVRSATLVNRAPGALVLCALLGVGLVTLRTIFLVARTTSLPSPAAIGIFVIFGVAPDAMLWYFVSRRGLMRTMTPANFEHRCMWFNLAGTLFIGGAVVTWLLTP